MTVGATPQAGLTAHVIIALMHGSLILLAGLTPAATLQLKYEGCMKGGVTSLHCAILLYVTAAHSPLNWRALFVSLAC